MIKTIDRGSCHGTCIDINGKGALIIGSSGSGKSGLALQLITLGAKLVADDQVLIVSGHSGVCGQPIHKQQSRIEARFFGLLSVPLIEESNIVLVIDMDISEPNRLPHQNFCNLAGAKLPCYGGMNVPNLAAATWSALSWGHIPN